MKSWVLALTAFNTGLFMKIMLSLILSALSILTSFGISREEALVPHIEQVMKSYEILPAEYQQMHLKELESYLALFTTSNDIRWNSKWDSFIKNMGKEFSSCRPAVIEAMVIAEAYQACFPEPESRISTIASVLFSEIPTNAIVFIHQDVFEGILRIEQQASGLRKDAVIINSGRIMDASYIKIVSDRYPSLAGLDPSTLKGVFEEARKQKNSGNKEFANLQIVNGIIKLNGHDIVCSASLLMAKAISKANPSRPALILPAVREFWKPISAWNSLTPSGIFCYWNSAMAIKPPSDTVSSWAHLLDAVAPLNQPLQVRLSNATGKTINAAGFVHKFHGDDQSAKALFQLCGTRMKSLRMVDGASISMDENGTMVELEH